MTAAKSYKESARTFANATTDYLRQAPFAGGTENFLPVITEARHEMMDFMAMRLEKDSDTLREFARCASWAEASQIHLRWAQDMIRDYGAEMTKMVAICAPRQPGQREDRRR
jgi:hypothetical protein